MLFLVVLSCLYTDKEYVHSTITVIIVSLSLSLSSLSSNNSISDIGAEELGTALTTNSTLRGLSLWKNRVFHSGAEGLANGLVTNTTLTWLGVSAGGPSATYSLVIRVKNPYEVLRLLTIRQKMSSFVNSLIQVYGIPAHNYSETSE